MMSLNKKETGKRAMKLEQEIEKNKERQKERDLRRRQQKYLKRNR